MSRTGMAALVGVWLAGALAGQAAETEKADDNNPQVWKSRVSSVAVFKNGLGFCLREGQVELRDGWCVAGEVPPAHFGTLAIFSYGKDELVDIVAAGPGEIVEFNGVDAGNDIATKRARLEASRLLKLQLTYMQKDAERTAAGKLVSIGPDFVVLETENSSFAVPLAGIKKMQVLEQPLRMHVSSDGGKAPLKTTIGMAYLRKGLTWIPEYTLKILDDENAELSLRGTLVNEAEDLVHCDVNFVVGVPHFQHTDYMAPLAVGQVIRTIGTAVAPREVMGQFANRAMIANDRRSDQFEVVDLPAPAGGRDVRDVLGNLPQMEGAGGGDFTVYKKRDLTVRRGEKAIVTLFVKKIKYGHIYRWNMPETMQHLLVMKNDTDSAWTTGPCLAIDQGGNPLSEDLLLYVAKGGNGEFPVTTAINIAQSQKETEIDRKLKTHEPSREFWVDLVTLQGELMVRNYEKKKAEVLIAAKIAGRPLTASSDGVIGIDASKLQLLERAGAIRWKISLEPGETKTLTYSYERYVPSR